MEGRKVLGSAHGQDHHTALCVCELSASRQKHAQRDCFRPFPFLFGVWLFLVCWGLMGCAQAISREGLARVDEDLPFALLREEPQLHLGKTILLGGMIIEAENHSDRTVLVVVHHGLGLAQKPDPQRGSGGRFLFQVQEFLDPAIFRSGRLVTVLGEVAGTEMRSLQDSTNEYPVIAGSEIYLWPDMAQSPNRNRIRVGLGVGIEL